MGIRGPLSSAIRDYVVSSYIRGTLASLDEGGIVAGVSRQTVQRWLKAARIDWRANRLRYLIGQHRKAMMIGEGRSVKRPSKRELRRQADEAKAKWDKDHGQHP